MPKQPPLSISFADSAYQDNQKMTETVAAIKALVGDRATVDFDFNGIDAASCMVECAYPIKSEDLAAELAAKFPHIEEVSMRTRENLGEGNCSYYIFKKGNGQVDRIKVYSWKSTDSKPFKQKLNIKFNTLAYDTPGMREGIVKTIRDMPEVATVRYLSDGVNVDSCTVTVKDAATRSAVSQKVAKIPGVDRTFDW